MLCLYFIIGEASSGEESDSEQEVPKGYTDENSSWLKLATGKGKQKLMVRSYNEFDSCMCEHFLVLVTDDK